MVTESSVRAAAVRHLARREYATRELATKLSRKFDPSLVETVLAELAQDGLLSDRRFAEMLVRSRATRGYGPKYISAELAQKGVDAAIAEEALGAVEAHSWLLRASQIVAKKRSRNQTDESLSRYLSRRGFPSDVVYRAVRSSDASNSLQEEPF